MKALLFTCVLILEYAKLFYLTSLHFSKDQEHDVDQQFSLNKNIILYIIAK